jgi:hypothetical protein
VCVFIQVRNAQDPAAPSTPAAVGLAPVEEGCAAGHTGAGDALGHVPVQLPDTHTRRESDGVITDYTSSEDEAQHTPSHRERRLSSKHRRSRKSSEASAALADVRVHLGSAAPSAEGSAKVQLLPLASPSSRSGKALAPSASHSASQLDVGVGIRKGGGNVTPTGTSGRVNNSHKHWGKMKSALSITALLKRKNHSNQVKESTREGQAWTSAMQMQVAKGTVSGDCLFDQIVISSQIEMDSTRDPWAYSMWACAFGLLAAAIPTAAAYIHSSSSFQANIDEGRTVRLVVSIAVSVCYAVQSFSFVAEHLFYTFQVRVCVCVCLCVFRGEEVRYGNTSYYPTLPHIHTHTHTLTHTHRRPMYSTSVQCSCVALWVCSRTARSPSPCPCWTPGRQRT